MLKIGAARSGTVANHPRSALSIHALADGFEELFDYSTDRTSS